MAKLEGLSVDEFICLFNCSLSPYSMPGPVWGPRGTEEHRTKVILCLAGVRLSKEGNNLSSLGAGKMLSSDHLSVCPFIHPFITETCTECLESGVPQN